MKRIVWIAVTILIMIAIMGFGLHTLNQISEVNQQRHEKEAGEEFAAKVVMVTETTSIWEKVRENQEKTTETGESEPVTDGGDPGMMTPVQTDENGQQIAPPEQAEQTDAVQEPETGDLPAETMIIVVP